TVVTDTSWTLADNFENATISTAGAINITGNSLDNVIIGNTGQHVLSGGAGNDTYYVYDDYYLGTTTIVENSNSGVDEVRAYGSWTLAENIENLVLLESTEGDGIGNSLANIITGNRWSNTLDGGAGADVLTGGRGDDTYVVDNSGDVVVELAGEG